MGEIKTLPGVTLPGQINDDAIKMVETLLERLKSGHALAIATVEVTADGGVFAAWSEGNYHMLNSGAASLAADLASYVKGGCPSCGKS